MSNGMKIESRHINGYKVELAYAIDPENPLDEISWCTMVGLHRRHEAGHRCWKDRLADDVTWAYDKLTEGYDNLNYEEMALKLKNDVATGRRARNQAFTAEELKFLDCFRSNDTDQVKEFFLGPDGDEANSLADRLGWWVMPVYIYDHSGVIFRTRGFSDRWDSGRCGFIYTTPERAEKEGVDVAKAGPHMSAVVDMYSQWASGEVYTINVYNGEDEFVDGGDEYYDRKEVEASLALRKAAVAEWEPWLPRDKRLVKGLETELAAEETKKMSRGDYCAALRFAITKAKEIL